ncbi:MAG: hypothetical protein ACOCXQ_01735 [Patescibacteria group bacterium]
MQQSRLQMFHQRVMQDRPILLTIIAIGIVLSGLYLIVLNLLFFPIISSSGTQFQSTLIIVSLTTIIISLIGSIGGIGLFLNRDWGYISVLITITYHLAQRIFMMFQMISSPYGGFVSSTPTQRVLSVWILVLISLLGYLILGREVRQYRALRAVAHGRHSLIGLTMGLCLYVLFSLLLMQEVM